MAATSDTVLDDLHDEGSSAKDTASSELLSEDSSSEGPFSDGESDSGFSDDDDPQINLNIQLCNHAKAGRLDEVRKAVAAGADINYLRKPDHTGSSAMMLAASNGHFSVLQFLYDKGGSIHCTTRNGTWTILHAACRNGHGATAIFVINRVGRKYAKVVCPTHPKYPTALHTIFKHSYVVALQLLRELQLAGADIDACNEHCGSPLYVACCQRDKKFGRALIDDLFKAGADPLEYSHGHNPLVAAIKNGYYGAALMFMEHGMNPNVSKPPGSITPFQVAIEKRARRVVAYIRHSTRYEMPEGLVFAANRLLKSWPCESDFEEYSDDDFEIDYDNDISEAQCRVNELCTYAFHGHFGNVRRANYKTKDTNGICTRLDPLSVRVTPLIAAVAGGHANIVTYLMDNNADPTIRDETHNWTVLHAACDNGDPAMLERFLFTRARGLVNEISNGAGGKPETALHACLEHDYETAKTMIDMLLAVGADINIESEKITTPLCTACSMDGCDKIAFYLISRGASVNPKIEGDPSPLSEACQRLRESLAIELLNKGADPLMRDDDGMTPLEQAIDHELPRVVSAILDSTLYVVPDELRIKAEQFLVDFRYNSPKKHRR